MDKNTVPFLPPPPFLLRSILPPFPSYLPFNDKACGLFSWKYDFRVFPDENFDMIDINSCLFFCSDCQNSYWFVAYWS